MDYKEKEQKELLELADKHHELTVQAEHDLIEETHKKDIHGVETKELETDYKKVMDDYEGFQKMENIGLKVEKDRNSLRVKRARSSKNLNILGIVVGPVFIYGFLNMLLSFYNAFVASPKSMGAIIGATLGLLFFGMGVYIFYKSAKFLLQYWKLEIIIHPTRVEFQKNVNLELKQLEFDKADLHFENKSNGISLMALSKEIWFFPSPSYEQKINIDILKKHLTSSQ